MLIAIAILPFAVQSGRGAGLPACVGLTSNSALVHLRVSVILRFWLVSFGGNVAQNKIAIST